MYTATYIRKLSQQIQQEGIYSLARVCCQKGLPIETFFLALKLAKKNHLT